MDKDKILEQAKKQPDERMLAIYAKANQWHGIITTTALVAFYAVLNIYSLITEATVIDITVVSCSAFLALSLGWLARDIYNYVKLREKSYLVMMILEALCALCMTAATVLNIIGI